MLVDVAEDAAEHEQVDRDEIGVQAWISGIAATAVHGIYASDRGRVDDTPCQPRVQLNKDSGPWSGWPSGRQSRDDIPSLAGAEAQQARTSSSHGLQSFAQAAPDHLEAPPQPARRIVVCPVPFGPIPHPAIVAPWPIESVRFGAASLSGKGGRMMPKLRVHNVAISLDGYAAGPNQDLDNPLGVGGPRLHEWVFATRSGRQMHGMEGGDEGLDDEFVARGDLGIGATIMGRNMFGPIRGPWGDAEWTGWWGEDAPYHHPVFVLTHHVRPPLEMQGGTTFHFVDDGIEAALERAFVLAEGKDVRLGGGASVIEQYLGAGLIDEMHLAIVPILLGSGERLFDNLEGGPHGYECVELVSSASVAHARFSRATDARA